MKYNNVLERCGDGCRTSLLKAGECIFPVTFHTLLPPCHPYITIHFVEMIFPLVIYYVYPKFGVNWTNLGEMAKIPFLLVVVLILQFESQYLKP